MKLLPSHCHTIVLFDEDPSIQMLMSEELDEDGYTVIVCTSIPQLLEQIKQSRPDLVIMEIGSRRNCGLNLLQDIRNTYYDLPVIIWTQYFFHKYDSRVMAADYFVLKKVDLGELKSKIKKALECSSLLPKHNQTKEKPLNKPPISLVRKK